MTKEMINAEIKKTAKEENCSELEIITAMQGTIAHNGDSKLLDILCEIKMEYVNV